MSMKSLSGTVSGLISAPRPGGLQGGSSYVPTTIDSLLTAIRFVDKTALTQGQINDLLKLNYINGSPIFTLNDRPLLYQLLTFFYESGYPDFINYLQSSKWENRNQVLEYLPTLSEARKKMYRDINAMKEKAEAVEGLFVCGKCGSRRTFSLDKQLRSADEACTTFVTCADCNSHWRVG